LTIKHTDPFRHHVDRHALVGDASQWLERLPHHAAQRPRPIEHIAAVNDQIDFASECWLQCGRIVGQEVVAAPSPIDARVYGEVEAEVGVGD
jgi:hypothetical protein